MWGGGAPCASLTLTLRRWMLPPGRQAGLGAASLGSPSLAAARPPRAPRPHARSRPLIHTQAPGRFRAPSPSSQVAPRPHPPFDKTASPRTSSSHLRPPSLRFEVQELGWRSDFSGARYKEGGHPPI